MKFMLPAICFLLLTTEMFAQQQPQTIHYRQDPQRQEKLLRLKPMLDSLYSHFATSRKIPGFIYGVVSDGKLLYWGGTGFQDLDKKLPVNAQTVWRLASMTKSFTALAILQLRDAGRLKLDDDITAYIPEWKHAQPPGDAPTISIRHLLTHTAGLPEDNPWGDRQLANTEQEFSAMIAAGPSFSNVPGWQYEYSNYGYTLLGRIISKVSGMPYQAYIKENILEPLGMKDTYWDPASVPASKIAKGYAAGGVNEKLLGDGAFGAMGGMLSSLEDFARYMWLHIDAWPPGREHDEAIIRHASLREMHLVQAFSGLNAGFRYMGGASCAMASAYAFGLRWNMDCSQKIMVGHSGGLPGFGSNWTFLPEYGFGIVAFANSTYAPVGNLHLSIADTIVKRGRLEKTVPVASPQLQQAREELMKLLPDYRNAQTSPLFADNFFPDQSLAQRKKEAQDIFNRIGKIISVGDIEPQNLLRGSFIVTGEKGSAEIFFTLSPQHPPRIQHLRITEIRRR